MTKFAMVTGFHLAAELLSHGLHAIANTQYRYASTPNTIVSAPGIFLGRRLRPTGQNDGPGAKIDDFLLGHITRDKSRNTQTPISRTRPRNQLGVLTAKIMINTRCAWMSNDIVLVLSEWGSLALHE